MEQFTPTVSESDVERIIRRDLPSEAQDEIRAIVRALEVIEKPRLKNWLHIEKLPEAEQNRIIEKDKSQYLAWLHRES